MDEFVSIEELVAEWERDPAMAQRLREARARLAPKISRPGEERYERLMRGEGPPRPTDSAKEGPDAIPPTTRTTSAPKG